MYLLEKFGETGIQILFFSLMSLIFYLFIIRPRQKEEEEKEKFTESLKVGKLVVTIGGIHGKITAIDDTTAILEIDRKGSQLTVSKQAITTTYPVSYTHLRAHE